MESFKFLFTSTFFPPYHIGGDAIHVYLLMNELIKLGHEVTVCHLKDSYYFQTNLEPTEYFPIPKNASIHSIKSPLGLFSLVNSYMSGRSNYFDKKMSEIISNEKPDVIHHHNIAGFGPSILNYSAEKVIYTAHDYWLVCPISSMTNYHSDLCDLKHNCSYCSIKSKRPPQVWRYFNKSIINQGKIEHIIAPSAYMKQIFINSGINKPIKLIPNFIPFSQKNALNIPYQNTNYDFEYFLFVGVLEKHKGILELINIFQNIENKFDKKLIIIGHGSLEKQIKNNILNGNNKSRFIFFGKIDHKNLFDIYSGALAVIIPSICPENNPLVGLEALSQGIPIISSNMGGLPEITKTVDKDLIFDSNNFTQLGEIIQFFNPNKYKKSEIKKIFYENYSSTTYLSKYLKLIGD